MELDPVEWILFVLERTHKCHAILSGGRNDIESFAKIVLFKLFYGQRISVLIDCCPLSALVVYYTFRLEFKHCFTEVGDHPVQG